MMDNEHFVNGHLHVKLHAVGPKFFCSQKRSNGVLPLLLCRASVSDDGGHDDTIVVFAANSNETVVHGLSR